MRANVKFILRYLGFDLSIMTGLSVFCFLSPKFAASQPRFFLLVQTSVLILAAGRGLRAGAGLPKQYRSLAGQPLLARTIACFIDHPQIDRIIIAIHPDDRSLYEQIASRFASSKLDPPVYGGGSRQDSVRLALNAIATTCEQDDIVLVHDAARPFVTHALVSRVIETVERDGTACPAVRVADSLAHMVAGQCLGETIDRNSVRRLQTPQGFRFGLLEDSHRAAERSGKHEFTDDGSLVRANGTVVTLIEGDENNMKITTTNDMIAAERILSAATEWVVRSASGFDVHAFTEGDHVWLGGIRIEHDRGVKAHSDGDVLLHALTDAILGCLAEGDIGMHFPPSDPRWKGASSDRFLGFAVERCLLRGAIIDHLDATVICEAPRLSLYRDTIVHRIAQIANLHSNQISIKATTSERLGFTGRGEGLAAMATATVRLPKET